MLHTLIDDSSITDADCAAAVVSFTGDINAYKGSFTVLHRSITERRYQTVAALGARGDVDSDKWSMLSGRTMLSPLHYTGSRPDMVAALLLAFPTVIHQLDAQNCSGATALHFAAAYGRSDNVQLLLDLGADATLRDNVGRTAEEWTCNGYIADVFAKHTAWKASHRRAWMATVTSAVL